MNSKQVKFYYSFILFVLLMSVNTFAADRYWIAASSNTDKNWTSTANWSTTATGAGGASVPGAADDVYFTSNGLGELVLDATISVRKFTINSGYTGTISQNGKTITVGIYGMVLNDGTFIGNTGNITVNGPLTLGGVNFTSTSGILTIWGSYTKTAGSFTHNNGNVTFKASGTLTGSTDFYDLSLNCSAPATY